MPDLHNSFNTLPNQQNTSPEQPSNYFTDFSQFGGEWQEPVNRSTNQKRGAKAANAAGFTFSFGEQSMDEQPYTVTETAKLMKSEPGVAVKPKSTAEEAPDVTTQESPDLSSKPLDQENITTLRNTELTEASEREDTRATDPIVLAEPTPDEEKAAYRQSLIDQLFPYGVHDVAASTNNNNRPNAGAGRHFADGSGLNYEKRWARESNYRGRHFADEPSSRAERRWQQGSSNLGGRHFANESENQYGRHTREESSAEGKRFREEEPKAKGGRHFAEEADQKERSRGAKNSSGEAGKHFRAEQEKNNLLKNILSKVKKSKGFKAVVSVALAGIMAFSVAGNFSQGNQASAMEADAFEAAVQAMEHEEAGGSKEAEQQYNELTGYEALDKLIDGSFEQDDNPGCYEVDGKVSPDAVANPNQIFELMGVDSAKATAEDYGKAFEYIAYSMKYPAAYIAVANNFEGFEGLSTNQAEQKIAAMSDNEKQDFQAQLKDAFGHTTYSFQPASGVYRNYGITGEGTGRHSYFVETNLDDNTMLLEAKTVDANGNLTITYSKTNCDNPVDFIVRYDSAGNYTVQTVNITESSNPSETPETSSEDSTEPDNTDQPNESTESIEPKDRENAIRIDKNIMEEVADDILSNRVETYQNPGVKDEERTAEHTSDEYEGTNPTIVQNDSSQNATTVQEDISYDNEYTENRGGTNMGEYSPVQENPDAVANADSRGDTASDATGGDIGDALANDGVNL